MIRKLTENDRESVLKYAFQEPSLNIFIIGDIENYGFDKDFQTVYGEFDEFSNYISVLLNYRENMIYYSHTKHFNKEWLKTISNHNYQFFSGSKSLIELIEPIIGKTTNKTMYFAEARKLLIENNADYNDIIELTTKEEAGQLYDLLIRIPEFFGMKNQKRDKYIQNKTSKIKDGKTYFIKKDNQIISTVATVAETSINAMVIAVATSENYRKLGLASKLMIHLMNEYLINKQKYLCLFYDNPEAGKIYKRLGFVDIDHWVMLIKE